MQEAQQFPRLTGYGPEDGRVVHQVPLVGDGALHVQGVPKLLPAHLILGSDDDVAGTGITQLVPVDV